MENASMDNAKVIEVINQVAVHDYLSHLIDTKMKKITLTENSQNAETSKTWDFIIVEDLEKIASLYGNHRLN